MKLGEVAPASKTALVTGASKGIGRCYALQLAAAGYKAVANVIQEVVGISIALSIYCAARFKKGGSV